MLAQSKVDFPMEWVILYAMNELCKNTSYNDLKIQDVCKEAAISKPTFYRYFQNKSNAVRWHMKKIALAGVCQIGQRYTWHEGIYVTLCGILELKSLYQAFDRSDSENPFGGQKFTGDLLRHSLTQTLTEVKRYQLIEELEFQIQAVTNMLGGALGRFASQDSVNPEKYAIMCENSIPNPIRDILNIDNTSDSN